ncbi:MAG: hypothetical protein HY053_02540 [Proteobacteria bacterium]|nr:hypothetical protein [Pseudomonadota bacterium]
MSILLHPKRRNTLKTILLWAFLMIPASAFLYSTNAAVRALENEMDATAGKVAQEKESLRVLRAEWAYLNSPQRLAAEAKQHLSGTQVAEASQVLPMQSLGTRLAMRDDAPDVADAGSGSVRIAFAPGTPAEILAKPIAYDGSPLAALHRGRDTIPAAATWTQKLAGTLGFTPSLPRSTP